MRVRRANFTNILLFLIIGVALFLIQRIALFNVNGVGEFNMPYRELFYPEYVLALLGLIGFSVWYFFCEKKKGDVRIHYPFIILLSVLFIISLVTILTFPSELQVDVPVFKEIIYDADHVVNEIDFIKHAYIYVSPEQRVLYIIVSFTVLYLVYIFIWVLPRKVRYLRELDVAMYIILAFAAIAIIYSLIVDRNEYVQFFVALRDPDLYFPYGIKSFLGNRNSFGILMTFSCFSSLYLHHVTKKWWFIPISLVFIIESIFISSKTNVLVCLLVEAVYLIALFVMQFKKRLKFSIIFAGVIGLLLLIFGGLSIIHYVINKDFLARGFSYVDKLYNFFIVNAFQNASSFTGRNKQYSKVLLLLDYGYWGVGLGYGLFSYVFQGLENIANVRTMYVWDRDAIYTHEGEGYVLTDTPHSSYYQILGTGGIVTLVIYFLLIAYLIFAMVRVFKKHKLTVIMCAAFLFGALLHGLTEAPTLFFVGPVYVDSLLFTSIITIPILSLYYHEKHPSENKKFLADYQRIDTKIENYDKPNLVAKSIYFFAGWITIIVCGICPIYWNPLKENILLVGIIISLVLFVVCPFIAYLIFGRKTKITKFLLELTLPYFVTVAVFIGFAYLYRLAFGPYTMALALIMGLFLTFSYFALFSVSKFMFPKAGVITLLLDKFCNLLYKHQSKYIELSNEKDSLTLQEKFFWLLTPKKFRRYETRDN